MTRTNLAHTFLIVASCIGGPTLAWAQDEPPAIDLRPQFKQDRTARYKVWSTRQINQTMSFGPQSRTTETQWEINGQITWIVKQVNDDGSAACTMTIDWLTYDVTGPEGNVMKNDSRKDSGDVEMVHRLLTAITGVPISFEVAADGTVQSVSGAEAVADAAGEGANVPEDLDYIENATDLAMLPTAPQTAAAGDNWQTDFTWNVDQGKMNYKSNYKLASINQIADIDVAMVTGHTAMTMEPDLERARRAFRLPPEAPDPGVQLLAGQRTSQIMFDLSRHEVVGRNTVETRTIETSLEFAGNTMRIETSERIHGQLLRIDEQ